jgi:uncharacterized membrane protein YfcA
VHLAIPSDPLFWLAAALAVTFQGLAKGGFSGIGIASTPLLALVVAPLTGAAILLPIMLLQDVISVWVYRRAWSAWNLKVMLAGALAGVGAAWLLAAHISDAQVRLAVGVIALAFVLYRWLVAQPDLPSRPTATGGVLWGALSAFTSAFAHAGSPPFQIHVLPQRLDKLTFVGTSTMFFAAVNLMKVAPYLALGEFSRETLGISVLLVPVAIATNFAGFWLVRRTPTQLFYKIAYLLVFVISLELIRSGLTAVIRG